MSKSFISFIKNARSRRAFIPKPNRWKAACFPHRSMHHVFFDKILARIGQQLTIIRMIDGFHADDFPGGVAVVLGQVAHEAEFFHARADNQDFLGGRDRGGHLVHVSRILFGAVVADDAGLLMLRRGLDHFRFRGIAGEVDDVSFGLVEPDDCVVKRHDVFLGGKGRECVPYRRQVRDSAMAAVGRAFQMSLWTNEGILCSMADGICTEAYAAEMPAGPSGDSENLMPTKLSPLAVTLLR